MTLRKYGYNVILASSGEKALQQIASKPEISLILMDINLGDGIDGTEAAELEAKSSKPLLKRLANEVKELARR